MLTILTWIILQDAMKLKIMQVQRAVHVVEIKVCSICMLISPDSFHPYGGDLLYINCVLSMGDSSEMRETTQCS